jgi:succinate dehydrogenase / fumarate reductase cytochrome b subunit
MALLFASPLGLAVIAGFVWSLLFHLLNGMRHLYWDAGRGLAPSTARMTAWAIYAGATVFTVIVLWAALGRGGA